MGLSFGGAGGVTRAATVVIASCAHIHHVHANPCLDLDQKRDYVNLSRAVFTVTLSMALYMVKVASNGLTLE